MLALLFQNNDEPNMTHIRLLRFYEDDNNQTTIVHWGFHNYSGVNLIFLTGNRDYGWVI